MKDGATDGLLLIDKPAGITSHTAVDRARHILGTRRIGHAGTLDPFATGLLILLVGKATRLLPFLDAEPKVYRATIRFGLRTTTDDLTGEPMQASRPPERAVVDRAIATLTGHLLQRPPAFSAKRVAGQRAYKAARRGAPLVLEPVGVTVHQWNVLGWRDDDLDVEIHCSGGTYVRALARDLGEAAGSAAHLAALRRLRSGRFSVDDARPLEAVEAGAVSLIPPEHAVGHLERHVLDDLGAHRVSHGQDVGAQGNGDVVALLHANQLLAIGVREGEVVRPKVVMRDA
jgi:tRNA pseudouridine55 synthase